jgi:hypothetical protein
MCLLSDEVYAMDTMKWQPEVKWKNNYPIFYFKLEIYNCDNPYLQGLLL